MFISKFTEFHCQHFNKIWEIMFKPKVRKATENFMIKKLYENRQEKETK